jgi:glycosyltransferase involved in cell wall biosynthesis
MPPLRVSLVDPSAFTPPYDRSLAAALTRAGADVELLTSHFSYGPVAEPDGYSVVDAFYRRSSRMRHESRARLGVKAIEHVPGMLRARRRLAGADVVHWQWLTLPALDVRLLGRHRSGQPRVLTLHAPLPDAGERGAMDRLSRQLGHFDAVVVHTAAAAERLSAEAGVPEGTIQVIPHGPLEYLTSLPEEAPLAPELAAVEGPVILFFGLLRPYKGIDTLLEAFARIEGAELWIAGMPRMPLEPLERLAGLAPGTVRFIPRFIPDDEIPALLRRADVLALPYREIEQSGVLYAGLAFAKPMVLGDVGGFAEVGREHGAAELVEPGDADALAAAIERLLADPARREELSAATRRAIRGEFGWEAIAARTLELYDRLGAGRR